MTTPAKGCSFQPTKKKNNSWRNVPVPNDGANATPVECFAFVANFILANHSTFTIHDFVNCLKNKEHITFRDIEKLYKLWTKEMAAQSRIELLPSCYDDGVWRVL